MYDPEHLIVLIDKNNCVQKIKNNNQNIYIHLYTLEDFGKMKNNFWQKYLLKWKKISSFTFQGQILKYAL